MSQPLALGWFGSVADRPQRDLDLLAYPKLGSLLAERPDLTDISVAIEGLFAYPDRTFRDELIDQGPASGNVAAEADTVVRQAQDDLSAPQESQNEGTH